MVVSDREFDGSSGVELESSRAWTFYGPSGYSVLGLCVVSISFRSSWYEAVAEAILCCRLVSASRFCCCGDGFT